MRVMNMRIRRKGEHPDWGTKIFDYGKNEVANFPHCQCPVLGRRVSMWTACVWMRWHPCCIWIMAKRTDEWVPNKYGGNKNLEAIEFFKHLNTVHHGTESGQP